MGSSVLTKIGFVKFYPAPKPKGVSKTKVTCGALATAAACGLGYFNRHKIVNFFTNLCGYGDYYPQPEDDSSPSQDSFHPDTRAIHDKPKTFSFSGFIQSGVMIIIGSVGVVVVALAL